MTMMTSGAPVELASFAALVRHLGAALAPVAGAAGAECYALERDGMALELRVAQVAAPPGRPWLSLAVPIGRVESFSLRAALVANAELPIGALALEGEHIVLRQTLPLDGLLSAQLDQAIRALAEVAAQLKAVAGGAGSPYAYVVKG